MHTDHAVSRLSSEPVSMRPIVDRQTPMKTLPSLAVGKNFVCLSWEKIFIFANRRKLAPRLNVYSSGACIVQFYS